MTNSSLTNRLGIGGKEIVNNDFPHDARIALIYIFKDLFDKGFINSISETILELNRLGRFTNEDIEPIEGNGVIDQLSGRIFKLEWYKVCSFCERVYSKCLTGVADSFSGTYVEFQEVQDYFQDELNLLIEEENLAFSFVNGKFHRKGRAQTQKAIERTGTVLSSPRMTIVKRHFNKARKFFDIIPNPDLENCVKEALCALEACIEILTDEDASKDFKNVIRKLTGNDLGKIPSPIGEGMIKIHSYRGSGQGVSHASINGYRVAVDEAELILSLVASYITYLVNIFPVEDDTPF